MGSISALRAALWWVNMALSSRSTRYTHSTWSLRLQRWTLSYFSLLGFVASWLKLSAFKVIAYTKLCTVSAALFLLTQLTQHASKWLAFSKIWETFPGAGRRCESWKKLQQDGNNLFSCWTSSYFGSCNNNSLCRICVRFFYDYYYFYPGQMRTTLSSLTLNSQRSCFGNFLSAILDTIRSGRIEPAMLPKLLDWIMVSRPRLSCSWDSISSSCVTLKT